MYTIYGIPNCSFCTKAKTLLEEKELDYDYIDIKKDIEQRENVMKLVPDMKTVPQIFENDRHIGGYTELNEELS